MNYKLIVEFELSNNIRLVVYKVEDSIIFEGGSDNTNATFFIAFYLSTVFR